MSNPHTRALERLESLTLFDPDEVMSKAVVRGAIQAWHDDRLEVEPLKAVIRNGMAAWALVLPVGGIPPTDDSHACAIANHTTSRPDHDQ